MERLPLVRSAEPKGESLVSLACGVPSLTVGLGALILLSSYLARMPIGSSQFYRVQALGRAAPVRYFFPSTELLWGVTIGTWCAGLGIYVSRRRYRDRKISICAAGLSVCGLAFLVSWLMLAWASFY